MQNRYRKNWSREETILAFDLYCKIPFSKISSTNKQIIELAQLIGRTPSSVGMKLANLASLDPILKTRNISGMKNSSKLDKVVFEEFNNSWEELSYEAQIIRAQYQHTNIESINPELELDDIPLGLDKEAEVKMRIGQDFFRKSVLNAYHNKCCVTGIQNPQLLIASHIKPWNVSDIHKERTNPCNGLCLNALHDKAFDKGLITLTKDYHILLSSKISETIMDEKTKLWFHSYANSQILLPEKFLPSQKFIEYHNDVIFQK